MLDACSSTYEVKARRIKTGSGIPFDKFLRHEQAKIIKLINGYWDIQAGTLTEKRVTAAIKLGVFPHDILTDLDENRKLFVESQFKPFMEQSVAFAGQGGVRLAGMMDAINEAVGAEILFTTNTAAINNFVNTEAGNLIVQMKRHEINGLVDILRTALDEGWSARQTATQMKKGIRLTARENRAVANFRERIFKQELKRFSRAGVPEPIKKANAVADFRTKRYQRVSQQRRGLRIAKTELKRAHEIGNLQAHLQAKEAGIIREAYKTWRKTSAADHWESTDLYNGKTIPVNESFWQFGVPAKTTMLNGDGPGEINELCHNEYSVVK